MKRVCIALALLATACNGGGSDDDGGIVNLDPGMGGNGGRDLPADGLGGVGGAPDGMGGAPDGMGGMGGTPEPEPMGLPVLGDGLHTLDAVQLDVIGTAFADGLSTPRDLAFHNEYPDQLWVVNLDDSSMTIFFGVGTDEQGSRKKFGFGNTHFMAKPSSLAFGEPGFLATAQEEDQITQPTTPADFMGPSLWTSDPAQFDAGHASHMDMLHNSPNSAGVAWAGYGNAYWIFDGYHAALSLYDFKEDHGLGGADHSDGTMHRYVQGEVGYVQGVPSHMELLGDMLYVADTGNNRVAMLDTTTGEMAGPVFPNYDTISAQQQQRVDGAVLSTVVDGAAVEGMERPSGLAIADDTLWITDNATSRVFAFDLEGNLLDWLDLSDEIDAGGLMGIAVGPAGDLFVCDALGDRILRISPKPTEE
ncbi:MAG: hypothetical protein H6704_13325 [Myxococcales bacterium]|nr:hypothetical protein [Myxococcales bacterium]